jgi:hypothetical protein
LRQEDTEIDENKDFSKQTFLLNLYHPGIRDVNFLILWPGGQILT